MLLFLHAFFFLHVLKKKTKCACITQVCCMRGDALIRCSPQEFLQLVFDVGVHPHPLLFLLSFALFLISISDRVTEWDHTAVSSRLVAALVPGRAHLGHITYAAPWPGMAPHFNSSIVASVSVLFPSPLLILTYSNWCCESLAQPRDICFVMASREYDDGTVAIVGRSVEDIRCPPTCGTVR